MLLSIITINLNNDAGLNETLTSILSQSFKEFEYLVIDGGSTDGSIEIISSNTKNINFYVSEPDYGIYNAMNKGLKAATGDYILFLNSGDTFVNKSVLEKIVSFLGSYDLIYGDIRVIDDKKSWIKSYPSKLSFEYFLHDTLPHPATFLRRELFYKIGFYNESNQIISDWEFFLLAINKYNCTYIRVPLIISNFQFNGISSRDEFIEIKKEETAKALAKHFPSFISDYKELGKLRYDMQALQNKYDLLYNSGFCRFSRRIRGIFNRK